MPKEEHSHSHSHPHRSHSKSIFQRIRPEIFAIVIAIIVIILGAIAGERLKPSQRQPQTGSRAASLSCEGTHSCPGTQQSCCVGPGTSCYDSPCLTQQASGNPRWTCCAEGYSCSNNECVKGGGSYQYQHCPTGQTLVCDSPAVTQCVNYPANCDALFPSKWWLDENACAATGSVANGNYHQPYVCQTNCHCRLPGPYGVCTKVTVTTAPYQTGGAGPATKSFYQINLSWSPVANALSTEIKVDDLSVSNAVGCKPPLSSGNGDFCITLAGGSTSYKFTAIAGHSYKFTVKTCWQIGTGPTTCNAVVAGNTFNCPGPTITPTKSPTPTTKPPTAACSYFAIDENSGSNSQLIKINNLFTATAPSVSLVKTYACSSGICEFEAIDANNSGVLYGISNTKKTLYKISKTTGDLSSPVALTPVTASYRVIAMSFRKSDNSLWVWFAGRGLYTLNPTTGVITQKLASTLDYMDGMAWSWDLNNPAKEYLYFTRTVGGSGTANEIRRYDPATNAITYLASTALPGGVARDVDGLDAMPGGGLLGAYGGGGSLKIFRYNATTKTTIDTYTISGGFTGGIAGFDRNIDSIAACVPN